MSVIRAHIQQGLLLLDEPAALPEGTVLRLVTDEPADALDDGDRAALHAALLRSENDFRSGQGRSMEEVLADLDRVGE